MLRTGVRRVTNIEVFFDLVYVIAVTRLSHSLITHPTVSGALHVALLLALVWLAWVYTTWVTNWLDPDLIPMRLMLIGLMLVSLIMSTGLAHAFETRGLAVGAAYAVIQVGRSAFTVWALRGEPLQRNFQRILVWCAVSGACALAGGLLPGHLREGLWLLAVLVDLAGGACGFYTPGLGRSHSDVDWVTIDSGHFAERCQAFILIALGESIVVTGSTFADNTSNAGEVAAFLAAFVGAAALWWIYFDRTAEDGARAVAASRDPGLMGTLAYHFVHPVMIAGIIATAAGDEKVLNTTTRIAEVPARWMVLGGTALFLAGHALFKIVVWRRAPVTRLAAIVVLALLGLASAHLSALTLAFGAAAVTAAVALTDRLVPHELAVGEGVPPTESQAE